MPRFQTNNQQVFIPPERAGPFPNFMDISLAQDLLGFLYLVRFLWSVLADNNRFLCTFFKISDFQDLPSVDPEDRWNRF